MLARSPSHYEILLVSQDADKLTIVKAYRKMTFILHPDSRQRSLGALLPLLEPAFIDEILIRIQAAYEALTDEPKRRQYDSNIRSLMEYQEDSKDILFRERWDQFKGLLEVQMAYSEMIKEPTDYLTQSLKEKKELKAEIDKLTVICKELAARLAAQPQPSPASSVSGGLRSASMFTPASTRVPKGLIQVRRDLSEMISVEKDKIHFCGISLVFEQFDDACQFYTEFCKKINLDEFEIKIPVRNPKYSSTLRRMEEKPVFYVAIEKMFVAWRTPTASDETLIFNEITKYYDISGFATIDWDSTLEKPIRPKPSSHGKSKPYGY